MRFRVALIGNMNNNHFAFLRFLLDEGLDAYLILYKNELKHFLPENDTFEIEKYKNRIIQSGVINGDFKQFIRLSSGELLKEFSGYDYYIACGFAPAYFNKINFKIDLFLPYCVGIEFTYKIRKDSLFDYFKEIIIAHYQKQGIRKSVKRVITLDSETKDKALLLGKKVIELPIPMLYLNSSELYEKKKRKEGEEFKIFCHVSHFKKNTRSFWDKRTDIVLESFKRFLDFLSYSEQENVKLYLVKYGDGTDDMISLVNELGISKNVIWLEVMPRKEIMKILNEVHVGFSELGGLFWGGTGWEFIATGTPFFHYLDLTNFDLSYSLPFFINSNRPEEIAKTLHGYFSNEDHRFEVSKNLIHWHNQHMGKGLIYKYLDIIKDRIGNND